MSAGLVRIGFMADGVWKLLIGISMLVLFRLLVDEHGAPGWLLVMTAVVVSASAVAEVVYAVSSGAGSYTKYLVAYDSGWVLTSAASLLLVATNADLAWTVWLGYQVIAALIVGVVFVKGTRGAARSVQMSSTPT